MNKKLKIWLSSASDSIVFSTRFLVFEIRPTSARFRIIVFSISARCSIFPFSAAIFSLISAAFSSWRTRSRVMSSLSPICSRVSFCSPSPKRRLIISRSRGWSITCKAFEITVWINWIFSFWIWVSCSIIPLIKINTL